MHLGCALGVLQVAAHEAGLLGLVAVGHGGESGVRASSESSSTNRATDVLACVAAMARRRQCDGSAVAMRCNGHGQCRGNGNDRCEGETRALFDDDVRH